MNAPTILMLVGGFVWICGELWGVHRNAKVKRGQPDPLDTTSQYVWLLEARWPAARVLIGMFLVSLVGHLSPAHTPLVP